MTQPEEPKVYRFFTEVGIINQLISTLVTKYLPKGMTAREFGILGHLTRRPAGCTPLELATSFQVAKTSMTHSLSMLEARELVKISPNPRDARSKIVIASEFGKVFLQEKLAGLSHDLGPLVAEIGEARFEEALPHLETIRMALDQARN